AAAPPEPVAPTPIALACATSTFAPPPVAPVPVAGLAIWVAVGKNIDGLPLVVIHLSQRINSDSENTTHRTVRLISINVFVRKIREFRGGCDRYRKQMRQQMRCRATVRITSRAPDRDRPDATD